MNLREAVNNYLDVNSGDDFRDLILEELLAEEYIQWFGTQAFLIGQILNNPEVIEFGHKSNENWDDLNNIKKSNILFTHFNEVGALEAVRDYMDAHFIPSDEKRGYYNIPDVDEPYNGIKSEHYEQFKKTKACSDLINILLFYV